MGHGGSPKAEIDPSPLIGSRLKGPRTPPRSVKLALRLKPKVTSPLGGGTFGAIRTTGPSGPCRAGYRVFSPLRGEKQGLRSLRPETAPRGGGTSLPDTNPEQKLSKPDRTVGLS
jgi:hypothetical protein